jgi:hypothetical protein
MPLRQPHKGAISLSFGRSTLWGSAARTDGRIISRSSGTPGPVRHSEARHHGQVHPLRLAGLAAPIAASTDRWSHLDP